MAGVEKKSTLNSVSSVNSARDSLVRYPSIPVSASESYSVGMELVVCSLRSSPHISCSAASSSSVFSLYLISDCSVDKIELCSDKSGPKPIASISSCSWDVNSGVRVSTSEVNVLFIIVPLVPLAL